MRTYENKDELKNEINKSFAKYISEFDIIPESLKDKRVEKRSQNAQKQGKILRQLQQNSEQRCKKPHLMQRVHLRMQL